MRSPRWEFFTIVALPWLVLSITNNNAVSMATVVAVVALPQSLFILFGGAIVDRISPYKTIVVSRFLLSLLMASLAIFVYLNIVPLWLIYIRFFSWLSWSNRNAGSSIHVAVHR